MESVKKSEEVVQNIIFICKERKISQKELAKRLGCSTRLIQYWIKGERSISIDMADRALKLLKIGYVLGEDSDAR